MVGGRMVGWLVECGRVLGWLVECGRVAGGM